ncbi:MAG TPA: hypothetical protein VN660_14125 [Steroidobacteraceae bacterium]|nr:hypothetical protein [Steroidobacteraceae bacterium]
MRVLLTSAVALLAVFAIPAGAQQAPRGTRISGTIKTVAADHLLLATASGDVDIGLTAHTRVLERESASVSDIKPGSYLGTSNQNSADDSSAGTATEVHLADNGPNVNFPMNKSGLTMTNGHVKAVTATPAGEEMDIDYGKGTDRHVLVKEGTPVTKTKELGLAALKPGVEISATTSRASDGKATASFIVVGPPPTASR